MEYHNLENEFIEELAPKHAVIVQTGVRHSGKSLWSCALLRHLMTDKERLYDEYHLIIPTWSFQAKDTFAWIGDLPKKTQGKITIYEEFSINVIRKLLDKSAKDKLHRYLYIDDATTFGELFQQSETLKDLITKARHYKITTHIITHHLKAVMIPLLRSNVSYYFLHRNVNSKFLEGIYEENLSLFYTRADWFDTCRREMRHPFPAIAIDRDRQRVDCGAMDWNFIKKQRALIIKSPSTSISNDDNKTVHKDKPTKNGCNSGKCTHRIQQGARKQIVNQAPRIFSRRRDPLP